MPEYLYLTALTYEKPLLNTVKIVQQLIYSCGAIHTSSGWPWALFYVEGTGEGALEGIQEGTQKYG